MKKLFTIMWDFAVSLVVIMGAVSFFLVFAGIGLIGFLFNHEKSGQCGCGGRYTRYEEDESFYDFTKRELALDNRRMRADLEAEKKRCNDVITLKNRLLKELEEEKLHVENIDMVKERILIENCNLNERVEDLMRYLAMERDTADTYRLAMDLTSERNEVPRADVARLENFIDMAAKDEEGDMKTSERTAKFYRDFVHGLQEEQGENGKKIIKNKMEKVLCVG